MWYKLCSSCQQPSNACSCTKVKSDNVTYTGPTLPCTGVDTNDTLTIVTQKINDAICYNLTSTTTTLVPNCTEWEATFTQSGTDVPNIVLLNSTFNEDYIDITYTGVGTYLLGFGGSQIPSFNVASIFLTGMPSAGFFYIEYSGVNEIILHTTDLLGVPSDDILMYTALYIKCCTNVPITPTTSTSTTL